MYNKYSPYGAADLGGRKGTSGNLVDRIPLLNTPYKKHITEHLEVETEAKILEKEVFEKRWYFNNQKCY